ncbi:MULTISPECIES: 6-phosphogluconolactonase [Cyanophyceae]|uniref:6-phosphogluconolactonase n=1 Tax=Cyanophyceae TaxID=3028117 RepID=UPI0016824784|nr:MULTISPECIES: 6-phosphogluconolactonase [Cyanophyceae]MBD1916387.1 6-phosphogluconolactonase [Phormidium sp. FACHB-77]MBD2032679.1 6-phosphogluconolactonase [Phormidium sp. FACHB-322]MBD2050051.1 6-phosphogluconolactonase [Leptolyngbya sp. FACHB-60]
MTAPQLEILPDKPALVQRALALVVEAIHSAVADHDYCTLALAGGSTPKPLYSGLAEQDLPWEKLYIFWGDERYVPLDHPDSNGGMAKAAWLDQVPIPPDHILYVPTLEGDPAASARQYEAMVRSTFGGLQGLGPNQVPRFDLILLGMGDDGHTASLFPHTEALGVDDHLITVGQKGNDPRLTFTAPLINHSHRVMFLVAGADKQAALAQVFATDGDDQAYPSRLVRPQGELRWLLDRSAVGDLDLAAIATS